MKIFVASDLHGSVEAADRIRSCSLEIAAELVVISGDITHFGNLEESRRLLNMLSDPAYPVLFVPGNCDPPSLSDFGGRERLKNIHGTTCRFGDTCFGGVGGAPPSPFDTPFELSDQKILQILESLSPSFSTCSRSILVSHPPPFGTSLDCTRSGQHVGSSSVRRYIEDMKPVLVLCGHIHESKGVDRLGDSVLVNPGAARDGFYAIADLVDDNNDIEVSLAEF